MRQGIHAQRRWDSKPAGHWVLRGAVLALTLLVATLGAVPRSQAAGPTWGLSTDRGYPQDTVSASGTGWSPDTDIFGYTDKTLQTLLFQTVTDSNGSFQGYQFTLPDLSPGAYRFYACQDCSHGDGDYFSFSVDPLAAPASLILDPSTGLPGDTVTASGTGWNPDTDIFGYTDNTLQTLLFQTVTDSNGSFQGYQFTLPNLIPGSHPFYACQDCANGIGDDFPFIVNTPTVHATLSLDTSAGLPGDTVTASGTGWNPDTDIYGYTDNTLQTLLFQTVTDSNGSFQGYQFTLPDVSPGAYRFYACQDCTNQIGASSSFTINRPATPGTFILDTSTGHPGDTVTASGAGWNPDTDIYGYTDNTLQTLLFQTVTDSNGSFQGFQFKLPDISPNSYQFYACQDCTNSGGASASFNVRQEAAPSRSSLPLVVGVLALLVLLAAGGAAGWRHVRRAALRRPRLKPRADPSFDVHPSPGDGLWLPSLRLVPRDDDSYTPGRVEVHE